MQFKIKISKNIQKERDSENSKIRLEPLKRFQKSFGFYFFIIMEWQGIYTGSLHNAIFGACENLH